IANAAGLVVYVANTTRQPGQTDGFGISDHVRVVRDYLGGSGLDAVLVNDDPPPDHLRDHYAERGLVYLEPTAAELARVRELGVRPVAAPIIDKWSGPRELWLKQDTIRHDPERVASRLVDLVVLRTYAHETIEEFARYASVPVINGLSDLSHPCQGLADIFTIRERKGLDGTITAYVGDGNNVLHSLMLCVAKTGATLRIATPEGYGPQERFLTLARAVEKESGARIELTD